MSRDQRTQDTPDGPLELLSQPLPRDPTKRLLMLVAFVLLCVCQLLIAFSSVRAAFFPASINMHITAASDIAYITK